MYLFKIWLFSNSIKYGNCTFIELGNRRYCRTDSGSKCKAGFPRCYGYDQRHGIIVLNDSGFDYCAEVFATGIKLCGLITLLLDGANAGGLGITGMSAVLSGLIAVVSFLTGSGVGALTSLGSIATDVANGLGGNVTQLISSMQFTAGLARGISPVAGATIVVAAAAGVSPIAIVRRTAIPMAGAWIVMMIGNYLLLN